MSTSLETTTNQASASNLSTSGSWEEEGVLNDILLELDRERTRRAELEAQIRALTGEQQQQQQHATAKVTESVATKSSLSTAGIPSTASATAASISSTDITLSRREYVALQTELEGYLQVIEALTRHNEAITLAASEAAAAAKQKSSKIPPNTNPTTLPVHVVRLLEIMPWDPRAQEHAFGVEEVYEWQTWKQNVWNAHIRHFPTEFQVLPVKKPHEEPQQQRRFLLDGSAPPQHTVLTNKALTLLYKISNENSNDGGGGGYPLPHDGGTWQWIGGWQIDRHVTVTDPMSLKEITLDCDAQGWTYAKEARHFLTHPSQCCYDNMDRLLAIHISGHSNKQLPAATSTVTFFRRRKWVRRRALVRYPHASEATMQFLNLLAENAKLNMSLTKMSDQLVETKTKLTEVESNFIATKEDLTQHAQVLEAELKQREELVRLLQQSSILVPNSSDDDTVMEKLDAILTRKQKEQLQQIRTQLDKIVPRTATAKSAAVATKTNTDGTPTSKPGEALSPALATSAASDVKPAAAAGAATTSYTSSTAASGVTLTTTSTTSTITSAVIPSKAFDWTKIGRGAILDKMKPKTTE